MKFSKICKEILKNYNMKNLKKIFPRIVINLADD